MMFGPTHPTKLLNTLLLVGVTLRIRRIQRETNCCVNPHEQGHLCDVVEAQRADVFRVRRALVAHDNGGQLRWPLDLLQRTEVDLGKGQHGIALELALLVLQAAALQNLLVVLRELGQLALVADELLLVLRERLQRVGDKLQVVREVLVVVGVQNVKHADVLFGAVEHVLAEEALGQDRVLDHNRNLNQQLGALEAVEVAHVALRAVVDLQQLVGGAVGLEGNLAGARHRVESQHDGHVHGLLVDDQVVNHLLRLHVAEVQRLVPPDGKAVDVNVVEQVGHLVLVLDKLLVRLLLQLLVGQVRGVLVAAERVVDVALLRVGEAVGHLQLVAHVETKQLAVHRHRVVVLAMLHGLEQRQTVDFHVAVLGAPRGHCGIRGTLHQGPVRHQLGGLWGRRPGILRLAGGSPAENATDKLPACPAAPCDCTLCAGTTRKRQHVPSLPGPSGGTEMFRYLESPGASPMAYNDDELSDYLDYDDMDYGMSPDYGDSSAPVFSIVDTKGTGASGYQGARKRALLRSVIMRFSFQSHDRRGAKGDA
ncbi:c-PI de-N-acetylase, putative [Babesia caballi]|uniref:C-PI de-N-acetylase, putative n=1 Tax=Babesia caballi TaxID=5871 RepID=A0AAV4LLL6_BABCB|nr:c-PI de-N-acetylase, putative [Babesia caballi]